MVVELSKKRGEQLGKALKRTTRRWKEWYKEDNLRMKVSWGEGY